MSTLSIVVALVLLPFVFAAVAALFADKRPRRERRLRRGAPRSSAYATVAP